MGVPDERYSLITAKNQREICLLKGFPCAWGRCSFCDYIEDNSRDGKAMVELNRQVLSRVTGQMGVLEVINSGSCFELPERTLEDIAGIIKQTHIKKLFFESHWMYRNHLEAMRKRMDEGYEIVIGSRFLEDKKDWSLRMVGSRLITAAIRLTTGVRVWDPTSGMRMFDRKMIREFALNLNYGPEPDTVSYLLKQGARIAEVPVTIAEPLVAVRYMVRILISILLIQNFRYRPGL